MKKDTTIRIFSSLLILLFAYAALSKLQGEQLFKAQLTKFPFIGSVATLLSWSIPIAELFAVLLLFIPKYQLTGFIVSTILLTVFTVFLIAMVLFAPGLPCSCGGIIAKLTWQQHIGFNIFFLFISILGIYLKRNQNNSLST
jgi:putative oxidoreductase